MKSAIRRWPAVVLLLSGCVSTRPAPPLGSLELPAAESAPAPAPPPVAAPPPEPAVEPAPPPVTPTPPASRPPSSPAKAPPSPPPSAPSPPPVAKPVPPEVAPEPAPAPPPPVVAARVANEDQIAQEVRQRVAKAQEIIDKIDATKLSSDQREILSSIQDFVAKAREAYQTKDMSRAQVLAEKASKLADDLATSVKR